MALCLCSSKQNTGTWSREDRGNGKLEELPSNVVSTVVHAARPTVAVALGNVEVIFVAAFVVVFSTTSKIYCCEPFIFRIIG